MTTTEPSPPTSDGDIHAEGISTLIQERKITEVVHFTTNRGLLGILVQQLCKARALLAKDEYLESIYHENTKWRREDPKYWSYVNLSISEANHRFLRMGLIRFGGHPRSGVLPQEDVHHGEHGEEEASP
ncbi:hypothetical protein ACF05H_41020, partial [Streptomyces caelestis]